MAVLKKGDKVYFSSVAKLVNEGTVESIEGPYIKISTKVPGVEYLMESQAFLTREDLRASKAYHQAWFSQQSRRHSRETLTYMGSMSIF